MSSVCVCVCWGVSRGEKVSIYVDIEGRCRKGLVKPFEGSKLYVGNGVAQVSRRDVFVNDGHLRWTLSTVCIWFITSIRLLWYASVYRLFHRHFLGFIFIVIIGMYSVAK